MGVDAPERGDIGADLAVPPVAQRLAVAAVFVNPQQIRLNPLAVKGFGGLQFVLGNPELEPFYGPVQLFGASPADSPRARQRLPVLLLCVRIQRDPLLSVAR
ncbi:hypothetical protein GCM10027018_01450 [Paenibacillus thermoaerophilus]